MSDADFAKVLEMRKKMKDLLIPENREIPRSDEVTRDLLSSHFAVTCIARSMSID